MIFDHSKVDLIPPFAPIMDSTAKSRASENEAAFAQAAEKIKSRIIENVEHISNTFQTYGDKPLFSSTHPRAFVIDDPTFSEGKRNFATEELLQIRENIIHKAADNVGIIK